MLSLPPPNITAAQQEFIQPLLLMTKQMFVLLVGQKRGFDNQQLLQYVKALAVAIGP